MNKFGRFIPSEESRSVTISKPRLIAYPVVALEILRNVCPDFKVRSALEVVEDGPPVVPCHRREEVSYSLDVVSESPDERIIERTVIVRRHFER